MLKIKTLVLIILIYIISFLAIKFHVDLFYPYYVLKDLVFFPVFAVNEEMNLDSALEEGSIKAMQEELAELKKINDLSSTLSEFANVTAMVIERNKMYWFNTITINKGKSSKIKEDMAVISDKGLIGRISKVGLHTSEVKLITTNDVNHKISVVLKTNQENLYGILSGYNDNGNYLEVTSVNKNVEISKDTPVYTSGMGGIYPSGILIGKVDNIIDDKYDVSKIIQVRPVSNFNDFHFVKVLIRK